MPPCTTLSKANVRCVGMIHMGHWDDPDDLNEFLRSLPAVYFQYGAIRLRAEPNEHDATGTRGCGLFFFSSCYANVASLTSSTAVGVFDYSDASAPPRRCGYVHRAAARVLFPVLSNGALVISCRVTHVLVRRALVHDFSYAFSPQVDGRTPGCMALGLHFTGPTSMKLTADKLSRLLRAC